MNVLVTIASICPEQGGPSRSAPALCAALGSQNVQVALLSQSFGNQFGAPLLPPAHLVQTRLVPCHLSRRFRIGWAPGFNSALINLAASSGAELIHDQGLWMQTNHAAARAARRLHLPLLVSPRGMVSAWAMGHKAWKKRFAWKLYQQEDLREAKAFHATSAEEAESLRQLGLRQPIAVIPNGVALPPLTPKPVREDPRRTLLFLGRINPKKGLLQLVSAWGIARPKGWRVIVAGPDEDGHRKEVEFAIRASHLEEDFTFLPPLDGDAKWALYRSADLFVLPTFSENFGITIAEALACELPVITTKGAPWAELETHRCGWWVEIGADPLAIALREATALSDEERQDRGQRGRRLMAQGYSWDGIAARMKSVYAWLLGVGPKPDCLWQN
ncbi:MAG: hypothetical protein QOF48_4060 [Verrucomicrobiota bacterium]|jgi:glycosyltransferase involved in cell wall biosynthesis